MQLLIDLIYVCVFIIAAGGILALTRYILAKLGITIPQPVMIVLLCVLAIICLIFLTNFLTGGGDFGIHHHYG